MGEDENVKGPILDAIKEQIAALIKDPEKFVKLVQFIITIFPKSQENLFSGEDPDLAELKSLLAQAAEGES